MKLTDLFIEGTRQQQDLQLGPFSDGVAVIGSDSEAGRAATGSRGASDGVGDAQAEEPVLHVRADGARGPVQGELGARGDECE